MKEEDKDTFEYHSFVVLIIISIIIVGLQIFMILKKSPYEIIYAHEHGDAIAIPVSTETYKIIESMNIPYFKGLDEDDIKNGRYYSIKAGKMRDLIAYIEQEKFTTDNNVKGGSSNNER